jgi:hypothetical protein
MCNIPRTILDEKIRALLGHQSKKEPLFDDRNAEFTYPITRKAEFHGLCPWVYTL